MSTSYLRHVIKNPYVTSAMLSEAKRQFLVENPGLLTDFRTKVAKFCYVHHGFSKYGLWRDDVRNDINPIVQEAIRRLPQSLMEERTYRVSRAEILYIAKAELPKEEWTQWEDDVEYLEPYIEEIKEELNAKKSWARQG